MNALLKYVCNQEWAMDFQVLESMAGIVERHANGIKLNESQIDDMVASNDSSDVADEVQLVGDVAIVPIQGVISKGAKSVSRISEPRGTSTGEIEQRVSFALDNPRVNAMVLRIDSPGGTIAGVEATSNFLRKANKVKPIVSFPENLAASASYWFASQASRIVAPETGIVGSIGVYSVFLDTSKAAEIQGVKVRVIGTGPLKGAGVPGTELTKAHEAEFKARVDGLFDVFVRHVARGRGLTEAQVREFATGAVFVGSAGLANKVIDQIGSIEDAIQLARNLASGRTDVRASDLARPDAARTGDKTMTIANTAAGDESVSTLVVEEKTLTETPATTSVADPPAPVIDEKGVLVDERRRVADIDAVVDRHGLGKEFADLHKAAGTSVQDVNQAVLNELAKKEAPVAVAVGADRNRENIAQPCMDAIMMRAETKVEKPHDRHIAFMGLSLEAMGRKFFEMHGVNTEGWSRADVCQQLFRASAHSTFNFSPQAAGASFSHTTSDFPMLLENVVAKTLRNAYDLAAVTWHLWMGKGFLPDFKQSKTKAFGEFAKFLEVKEGEEYTESTIGEAEEVYQLKKYGRLFSITWETLINDDLDAFGRIPNMMGNEAAQLVNDVAYLPLTSSTDGENMGDGVALFHANHNNLAGSGTDITVASLGAGRQALRTQKGLNAANTINVKAKYLLVPSGKETIAEQLIGTIIDPAASVTGVMNPFAGKLQIIPEPDLDSHDVNAWYLIADSMQIETVKVFFLEGQEAPMIQQEDGMVTDGRRYRVRQVVASKAMDWRGIYKNPGA